uniref:Uncharacterized protein n=1 Tax=viral metagenome TaxID=1070528 RepID=A0A6M3JI19_9ZZZZ
MCKGIFQKMIDLDPNSNCVFTAIGVLKTEDEVKQFYKEYIEALKIKNDTNLSAKELAAKNVGYICSYFSDEAMRLWYETLNIEHPIFGKTYPTPEEAFKKGQEMGEQLKKTNKKKGN